MPDNSSLPLIGRDKRHTKSQKVRQQTISLDAITSPVAPESLPTAKQEGSLDHIVQVPKNRALNSKEAVSLDLLSQIASYSQHLNTPRDQLPSFSKQTNAARIGEIRIDDLPNPASLSVLVTKTTTKRDVEQQIITPALPDDTITKEQPLRRRRNNLQNVQQKEAANNVATATEEVAKLLDKDARPKRQRRLRQAAEKLAGHLLVQSEEESQAAEQAAAQQERIQQLRSQLTALENEEKLLRLSIEGEAILEQKSLLEPEHVALKVAAEEAAEWTSLLQAEDISRQSAAQEERTRLAAEQAAQQERIEQAKSQLTALENAEMQFRQEIEKAEGLENKSLLEPEHVALKVAAEEAVEWTQLLQSAERSHQAAAQAERTRLAAEQRVRDKQASHAIRMQQAIIMRQQVTEAKEARQAAERLLEEQAVALQEEEVRRQAAERQAAKQEAALQEEVRRQAAERQTTETLKTRQIKRLQQRLAELAEQKKQQAIMWEKQEEAARQAAVRQAAAVRRETETKLRQQQSYVELNQPNTVSNKQDVDLETQVVGELKKLLPTYPQDSQEQKVLLAYIEAIQANLSAFTHESHTQLQVYIRDGQYHDAFQLLRYIQATKNNKLLAAYINTPCRCGLKTTALHFAAQQNDRKFYNSFKAFCIKLITDKELHSLHYQNSALLTPQQFYDILDPLRPTSSRVRRR